MKRLYLTVEGQTEEVFARDVLQPHLASFNVFLSSPRFTGAHGRRSGRIPRGGMFHTFRHALEDMRRWMKEDQGRDVRFSMMVDLYSLPTDFPGYEAAMTRPTGHDQAAVLQDALAAELADRRFIPYLQVHEFEALVLVDPQRLSSVYEGREAPIAELARSCAEFRSPEEINHGQHSHPKYRITQVIVEYEQNIAGPLIAQEIGLPALRSRCLHFNEWLTRLEQLDAD